MTSPNPPTAPDDNDWPEPEVKRYPGVVIVVGILVATGLLWSGCAFFGVKAVKLLNRPPAAAAAAAHDRLAAAARP